MGHIADNHAAPLGFLHHIFGGEFSADNARGITYSAPEKTFRAEGSDAPTVIDFSRGGFYGVFHINKFLVSVDV